MTRKKKVRGIKEEMSKPVTGRSTDEDVMRILDQVIRRIKPSKRELASEQKVLSEVMERLKQATPSDVEVVLVGSVAKGTQLKGRREFDVFMLFPKSYSRERLVDVGLTSAKEAFKDAEFHLAYAEHPYLSVKFKGFDIDVVPAYRISSPEERATAVDRSPLHTAYVNNHLTEKQKDDVRLLKQFMKAHDIYGAEVRVEGFSGYLCELLIIRYGSFLDTLKHASSWKIPTVIDIENYYGDKNRTPVDLTKVFDAPLIVIDPTDKKRNVAAVVSTTSMSIFILASRMFLKRPSLNFFFKRRSPVSPANLYRRIKQRGTRLLVIEFPAPDVVEDTLWPQFRKLVRQLNRFLRDNEFDMFGYYYWTDMNRCLIMFELVNDVLPMIKKVRGPSVVLEKPTYDFMDKHKNALDLHVEHDRIVAIDRRRFTDAKDAVSYFFRTAKLPSHFSDVAKKYRFLPARSLVSKRYISASIEYFTRTIKW